MLKRYVKTPETGKQDNSPQHKVNTAASSVHSLGRPNLKHRGEGSRYRQRSEIKAISFLGVRVTECYHSICRNWGAPVVSSLSKHSLLLCGDSHGNLPYKAKPKWAEKCYRESDEAIVSMMARTTQPCLEKGLYFSQTLKGGK